MCSNVIRLGPSWTRWLMVSKRPSGNTAVFLRWGNGTAKQGAIPQSDDVCADSWWYKAGTRWATEQLAQNPEGQPRRFSIHRSLHERLPTAVLGLNVLWVHAAKKAGKWHRGVLEAAERVMARWHVEEETHISERRAARILAFQRKITGGGVGKARLKKARRRW